MKHSAAQRRIKPTLKLPSNLRSMMPASRLGSVGQAWDRTLEKEPVRQAGRGGHHGRMDGNIEDGAAGEASLETPSFSLEDVSTGALFRDYVAGQVVQLGAMRRHSGDPSAPRDRRTDRKRDPAAQRAARACQALILRLRRQDPRARKLRRFKSPLARSTPRMPPDHGLG